MNAERKNFKNAAPRPKVRPCAPEAEAGLVGCVLADPNVALEVLSGCQEAGVKAEWFEQVRLGLVWFAIECQANEGKGLGMIEVQQRLRDQGALDADGLAWVLELPDRTPAASHWPEYVRLVREKYQLRQLLEVAERTRTAVLEAGADGLDGVLGEAERGVLSVRELGEGPASVERGLKPLLLEAIERLEDYHRGRPQMEGLGTSLESVDKWLCGIGGDNGNFVVLAGRPGMGKTSLALQIAMHVALDEVWWCEEKDAQGKPVLKKEEDTGRMRPAMVQTKGAAVGVFSLEMANRALVNRMLFMRSRGDIQRWRNGYAENKDWVPLHRAVSELHKAKILLEDRGRCTIEFLKAKARRWVRQHGVRLLVVDYLQLLKSGAKRFREDRVQELEEISGELQALGKELNVPLVVLAQMNRDYEKDPHRAPRLSDLKNCGAIEQDADVVGFLYEPKLGEKEQEFYENAMKQFFGTVDRETNTVKLDWSKTPMRVNLLVAKNRFGPTGRAKLLFDKASTAFDDWNGWCKAKGLLKPAKGERVPQASDSQKEKQEEFDEEGNPR